jgi:hypothetical protein
MGVISMSWCRGDTGFEGMKAIRFGQFGEPAKVLAVEKLPVPEPEVGEARVRILASRSTRLTCCTCGDTIRVRKRVFGACRI